MIRITQKYQLIISVVILSILVLIHQGLCADDFSSWLNKLRQEAHVKGISEATIHEALDNLEHIPRGIELESNPVFWLLSGDWKPISEIIWAVSLSLAHWQH